MPENIQRSRGRPQAYKFDRGGTPTEFGPFIGIVVNNIDPTRSGRLQVWISQFGATQADGSPDLEAKDTWRTVSYIPPFYGTTPHTGTNQGVGTFTGNPQTYGMWFTPPDLYMQVICFFVAGDPNQGYYIGCVPDPGINHMIPAIGASTKYSLGNDPQSSYFAGATQLPVTEINSDNESVAENPRFFDQSRPVHSYVAGIMMQQGLIRDTVRGPITSNSQRESPSAVFGLSTPGRAIYQGGLTERDIKQQLETGNLRPQDVEVIARRGGHSLVMDDGDLEGRDNLVRIRTAKGHQITMSDDGDCFYIIHANGQTWLEFGKQGTVDVFSTNSVNVRTQGTINLHADKDINVFAAGDFNVKAKNIKMESVVDLNLIANGKFTAYSKTLVGIKSDGALNLKSTSGAWDGGSSLNLNAGCINLNSGGGASVDTPTSLKDLNLADTKFVSGSGWTVEPGRLKTIVTRAPTHEPWPYHNQGVNSTASFTERPAEPLSAESQQVLDSIEDVAVTDGIEASDVLTQDPAEIPVGSMTVEQTTAVLAQTALEVDQAPDAISVDKGIGKYGLSAQQLEAAGYLKPGTVDTYLQDPAALESVLASPSVWTGKSDIVNLDNLLADPKLQSVTQNEIMISALEGLKKSGVITGKESPAELAPFVQVASNFGVDDTVSWVKGQAPAELVNQMNSVAKNGQYAVSLVDRANINLSGIAPIGGSFIGTTERQEIDAALTDILGDAKIPAPIYADQTNEVVEVTTETVTGGQATTVVRDFTALSSAAVTPEQQIVEIENNIASLEASIRFRQRRGVDASNQINQLRVLEARLAQLRFGA